jgi:tetratricopeptide (TPR) repeat protein
MPVSRTKRKKKLAKRGKNGRNTPLFLNQDAVETLLAAFVESQDSTDPVEAAQDIMYDAWEEPTRRKRIALAKKALAVSPLCADAYGLLALDEAKSPGEVLALYRKGVEAGKQALGPEGFIEYAGHFWGALETRPYMRALHGLALALSELGQHQEASKIYQEMLSLNPDDNQGVRYLLADTLLACDDVESLKKLIEKYPDDASAKWRYTQALLAFRDKASNANDLALVAWAANSHVPAMLSGERRLVHSNSGYNRLGGDDEASDYVAANGAAWRSTSGAIAWLKEITEKLEPPKWHKRLADG